MSKLIIYSMHRTDAYWRFVSRHLKQFHASTLVSDQLGGGDLSTQPRFYELLKGREPERFVVRQLGEDVAGDIVTRCRVLRSLDRDLAIRMVGAMWMSVEEIVRREKPDFALSFCIDRYSMDILARVAEMHGVPFAELTTSVLPEHVVFLRRGRGIKTVDASTEAIAKGISVLTDPQFEPCYVQHGKSYGLARYLRTFAYSELRGAYFNVVRHLRRDPLNCHYLDALKRLKHKIGYGDLAHLRYLDADWKNKFDQAHAADRVFLGLQVYPEASMDYWLEPLQLLRYHDVVERQVRVLSEAGFTVFVKDHPLMFGFRQAELYRRLSRYGRVVFVPYGVSGRFLVNECHATVTLTGTVGLEAALAGKCSVMAAGGIYHEPGESISYSSVAAIDEIPAVVRRFTPGDLAKRRHRLISRMVEISAPGSLTRVAGFKESDEQAVTHARAVAGSLNNRYAVLRDQLDLRNPRRATPGNQGASPSAAANVLNGAIGASI